MTTRTKGAALTPERWKELHAHWKRGVYPSESEMEEFFAATKPTRVVPGMTLMAKQRNHIYDCFTEAMRELSKHDMSTHRRIFTKYKTGQ